MDKSVAMTQEPRAHYSVLQCSDSLLKIGLMLAEKMGQGKVGGYAALADRAWQPLQLPVEKFWSMLGGLFGCLLAQMDVENAPFTLYRLHFWHFRQLPREMFSGQSALTIECSLMSWCDKSHEPTENVSIML